MLKAIGFRDERFSNRQYIDFRSGANLLIGPSSSNPNHVIHLIEQCVSGESEMLKNSLQRKKNKSHAFCRYELGPELWKEVINKLHCTSPKIEKVQDYDKAIFLIGFCSVSGDQGQSTYNIVGIKYKYKNENRSCVIIKSLGDKTPIAKRETFFEGLASFAENQDNACLISNLEKLCTNTKIEEKDGIEERLYSDIKAILENGSSTQEQGDSIAQIQQLLKRTIRIQHTYKETQKSQDLEDEEKEDLRRLLYPFLENQSEKELDSKSKQMHEEAKLLVHALHDKDTQTLCIEDPGMTFDSLLQERLRDCFVRQTNKVIIFTAQSTSFINADIVQNTHVCRQIKTAEGNEHVFVDLVYNKHFIANEDIKTAEGNEHVDLVYNKHFIANEDMKKVFLVPRVLFVEGETDEILLSRLLNQITLGNGTIGSIFSKDDLDLLQEFLSTTHIIKQGGHMNKQKCEELCDQLHVPFLFVFDRNVFVEEHKSIPKDTENGEKQKTEGAHDLKKKKSKAKKKQLGDKSGASGGRQPNDALSEKSQKDEGNSKHSVSGSTQDVEEVENKTSEKKKENKSPKGYLTTATKYSIPKQTDQSHKKLLERLEEVEKNKNKTMKNLSVCIWEKDVGKYKQVWSDSKFPSISDPEFEELKSEKLKQHLKSLDVQNPTDIEAISQHASLFHKLMICPTGIQIHRKRAKECGFPELLENQYDYLGEREYADLERVLKERKIFMWQLGNLEHVINMAIMANPMEHLPFAYKIWKEFPIMKVTTKEKERTGKRALKYADDDDLLKLCEILFEDTEVQRFIKFLIEMARQQLRKTEF